MQTPETLKTRCNPYGAEFGNFPPDKVLPVSVLHSETKSLTVQKIKSMSWEQHVLLWKVGLVLHHALLQILPIAALLRGATI